MKTLLTNHYMACLRSASAAALCVGASLGAQAQVPAPPTPIVVSSASAVYNQNFDALGVSGNQLPAGWSGLRLASPNAGGQVGELLLLQIQGPTTTLGAVYNAGPVSGAANDADRAVGMVGSGTTVPVMGAVFSNQTGAAVTRVNIGATMEQWRTGDNPVNEVTFFEYSLNATSLNTGTWTPLAALNLTEMATASTARTEIDGNLPANRAAISASITGISWPNNTTMWIRWRDVDDAGNDAMLAIDNFAMSLGTVASSNRRSSAASQVSLYPNPATDAVTIRTAAGGRAEVLVTDLLGRAVLTGTSGADGRFDTSGLPAGRYLFRVRDAQGTTTLKVNKQ